MAAFLFRSVHTTHRSSVVASDLSRNLLLRRFMASRPCDDETLNVPKQSRSPADPPRDVAEEQPSHVLSLPLSKAHLYVDLVAALRSPPGTFSRNQMFEIWCNNFQKSYSSEEEKLHRFKLFNNLLDYDIENKYNDDDNNNTPTTLKEVYDACRAPREGISSSCVPHRLRPSLSSPKKRSITAVMIKMRNERKRLEEFLRPKEEAREVTTISQCISLCMLGVFNLLLLVLYKILQ